MNYLVVGAGFAGAVYARELANAGHKVTVIDSRDHIAGNAYDYTDHHGIRIHKYGPHIFHTSNLKVVEWLGQYTDWVDYKHKVLAKHTDGEMYVLPPNRDTVARIGMENIVDTFFRPYTKKMWDKEIEELNPNILNRVPVCDDDNDLYFPKDEYQMMPLGGYTKMFHRIFDHENIEVRLSTDFDKGMEAEYDHTFNSMPIDVYYDYQFGELPYRSIKFSTHTLPEKQMYETATTNFTTFTGPTRVTEWKNFPDHGDNDSATTLTYEYPCDYRDNDMERYYPVKDVEGINVAVYKKYRSIETPNVNFIGRCGTYQYLDMHQVIAQSMIGVNRFLNS